MSSLRIERRLAVIALIATVGLVACTPPYVGDVAIDGDTIQNWTFRFAASYSKRMTQNKKLYTALALAGTMPFLALLLIGLRLRTGDIISAMYFRVRTVATLIAIASLLVIIASPR